ncbi:heavy metal translocating P-type ATPase [Rhodocytophaga aerolata]|uniref:P-type Zn(2+) transporter n=1 Tax=Rhodocytophaga aerolata TaxID=455078 RepID=A0ABT8R7R4_9BACT|nr:heavy metal translocating P-type ATPase [Rhodocytophaga aerolata]MDO1448143.1 heavy metal translocating P-type ATPase [Rhodocytophaga aerolata]
MATDNSTNKHIHLAPLEITSPRTAEKPGPVTAPADACCSTHAPVSAQAQHTGHNHGDVENSYMLAISSLALLVIGIVLDYMQVAWFSGYVRIAVFSVAYLLVGWKVIFHAIRNIAKGNVFNEFFLMSIATIGAFSLGEYAEGVAVMLFYVIGEHFQEAAVARSRKSIKDLIDNRPQTVSLLYKGQTSDVNPRQVQIGQTIQVKAGEKVALDGILLSDASTFNTSALTGESRPETKTKGDSILAGMISLDKVVHLQVSAAYENSALSRILKMVEEASSRKASTQQFITRFAKIYTPVVVFLAIGLTLLPFFFVETYVFKEWLYRALVFLVISCPCALVVSIPLGYFGGIGAASRNGILFKGSNFLDVITKVDTVVMDKTGTLTKGEFALQEVVVNNPTIDKQTFIDLAAALESQSTHPVARAIVNVAGDAYKTYRVSAVQEIPGNGLKGTIAGKEVLAGNSRLLKKFNIPYDTSLDEQMDTLVLVAIDRQLAGYFILADPVKADAAQAIANLHKVGINTIVMLSGDKTSIVNKVASQLTIDEAYGDLLPEDKVAHVEVLKKQGRTVAFVGDGINDAPVIALADVGMAMGGLGSDAAIETADVVIQTDQPSKLATAITIGKKTREIVWQNISLAFGVKALVLILGAGGVATLWEAVFADVGVAFLAILNAIRIQRMKFGNK